MSERAYDVAIAGAGVMGLALAVRLRTQGVARVCVVDAGQAGGGLSLLGGGGIRTQFAQPVNVALSLRMLQLMRDWADCKDMQSDFHASGYLYLAIEPEHDELRASVAETVTANGGVIERLTGTALADAAPGVTLDGVRGGWFTPGDGTASPAAVVQSQLARCTDLGVELVEGEAVRVDVRAGRAVGLVGPRRAIGAGAVVVAAGMGSIDALDGAGWTPPIREQRGQIFLTRAQPGLAPRMPLVFDMATRGYFVSSRRGLIIGGADREEATFFEHDEPERTVGLLTHRLPGLTTTGVFASEWGHRAASPDDVGILGAVPAVEDLYIATGFGHHGFMHALPAAEIMADGILGRAPTSEAEAMDPARFA